MNHVLFICQNEDGQVYSYGKETNLSTTAQPGELMEELVSDPNWIGYNDDILEIFVFPVPYNSHYYFGADWDITP